MGELFALAAAVVWALAVIMLKKSTEAADPFALNLFRVTLSLPLFLVTLIVLGQPLVTGAPRSDVLTLFASGCLGIAVADTLFHMSLARVGAGITAIIDCLYSPSVVLFAFVLIGERLGSWQLGGMVVVVSGVLIASRHAPPPGTTARRLLAGVILGSLGMAILGIAIVIAKPVLERSPVIWATAMRQIGCELVLLPAAAVATRRREFFAVFKPARRWRYMVPASLLGSYGSLILWIAGMKYTEAGSAAIVNQSSSIFVLVFATLFLKEAFTTRKLIACTLAVVGILMVTLG